MPAKFRKQTQQCSATMNIKKRPIFITHRHVAYAIWAQSVSMDIILLYTTQLLITIYVVYIFFLYIISMST